MTNPTPSGTRSSPETSLRVYPTLRSDLHTRHRDRAFRDRLKAFLTGIPAWLIAYGIPLAIIAAGTGCLDRPMNTLQGAFRALCVIGALKLHRTLKSTLA